MIEDAFHAGPISAATRRAQACVPLCSSKKRLIWASCRKHMYKRPPLQPTRLCKHAHFRDQHRALMCILHDWTGIASPSAVWLWLRMLSSLQTCSMTAMSKPVTSSVNTS